MVMEKMLYVDVQIHYQTSFLIFQVAKYSLQPVVLLVKTSILMEQFTANSSNS